MLNFIRIVLAILVILVIAPQTPKENRLLRFIHESELFYTYGEAKQFLNIFTWVCICLFLGSALL